MHRTLEEHCTALIDHHGSYRAAAKAVKVNHAYLFRMAMGDKSNPSATTLVKLGLLPTPLYLPRKP